ncbi:hypothetical protein CTAYLR_005709 [Chrysophaeum taylorii]|uniref:Uncharacterized protein n=1 Tax=Chrysophaeum taylorii TaxID=2483200 RepID=A0AAD7XHB9_9STRA|nr:hypothetical protein CTAYLR_005709 [Chrysophaeum taylorii]
MDDNEASGCISLMDSQSIANWYRCLDLTCMEQPTGDSSSIEASSSGRADGFLGRAEEEERKGNYRAASDCYRKALRLDPYNATAHNNFGYLCSTHTHDYATAEYHYRLAIRCSPDYALAHNNLAFFLKKNKRDFEGAEQHYREAIRCDPGYSFAHSNLGVLLKAKKDFEGAEKHYLAAISSNPRYAPAYLNYSLLLKNHDEATSWDYLKRAMAIDPSLRDSQAAQNLVRAFARTDLSDDGKHLDHHPRLAALIQAKKKSPSPLISS